MKIALCQTDIVWESKQDNLNKCDQLLEEIFEKNSGVDLVVFPEFFSVGYSIDSKQAEDFEGISVSWMQSRSEKYDVAIVGSIPTIYGDLFYNRCYFICPEFGEFYDKRHLFPLAGEDLIFTNGDNSMVVPYRGWNIALNICYDIRFPVWSRNVDLQYDILINVANWPSSRQRVIDPLVRARAIENISYMAFVNRVGNDPHNSYSGGSMISDYEGTVISCLKDTQGYIVQELSLDNLNSFRAKFKFWEDSDKFVIL